ncbi:SdpA family antimicrobial peptide system protein [Actinoplanes sp. NPDC020271]|uniref:SdpA family antimicrobial peptide system protein n=1 Tax=Actinoplanes sp. NPDC020271 TaxID=3363896 RepID=UPI00378AF085
MEQEVFDGAPAPSEMYNPRVQALVMIASALVLFGFILTGVMFTLPDNVLLNRMDHVTAQRAVNTVVPENWAFFTRDPQTPEVTAYRLDSGSKPVSLLTTPQNKAANAFGLSRNQRAQGVELGYLSSVTSAWRDCDVRTTACVSAAAGAPAEATVNTSSFPTACGDVYLAQEVPVPWNYRKLYKNTSFRINKVAHLEVSCPHR